MMWNVLFSFFAAVELSAEATNDAYIIGGINAEITDFPYMVSVFMKGTSYCGGTIISNCCIVTSALCLLMAEAQYVEILQGTNDFNNWFIKNGTIGAIRVQIHEDFNSTTLENNIGLIFLNSTNQFSEFASPVELDDRFIGEDQLATVLGWGVNLKNSSILSTPKILQQLQTKTISNQMCRSRLSPIGDKAICTFTREKEGICYGDPGGPLVANGKLIGVISGGVPCAMGYPDVYTRISEYIGWINANKAC